MNILKTDKEFFGKPKQKQEPVMKEIQPDLFGTSSKTLFLNSLRSQGKYKYSRYRGLPLRYAGGKSLGVGHVLDSSFERFPLLRSALLS